MLNKGLVATFGLRLAQQAGESRLLAKAGQLQRSHDPLGLILAFNEMLCLSLLWAKGFVSDWEEITSKYNVIWCVSCLPKTSRVACVHQTLEGQLARKIQGEFRRGGRWQERQITKWLLWHLKGSVPGSGRSPGGGHGNPLHYSCLENPMDRRGWWATVHRVTESDTN